MIFRVNLPKSHQKGKKFVKEDIKRKNFPFRNSGIFYRKRPPLNKVNFSLLVTMANGENIG